ncbi:hypothetical protein BHM03_00062351 [Ensete ventricosum]|nr:hypothetical protein BHM03_00062351 [Ensete ventricosum]
MTTMLNDLTPAFRQPSKSPAISLTVFLQRSSDVFLASFPIPSANHLANSLRAPTASWHFNVRGELRIGVLVDLEFRIPRLEATSGDLFFILIFAAHVMHPLRFPNSGIRAKGRHPRRHPRGGACEHSARKGGACGHSARKSCCPRGNDARPPIGAATPAAKGAAYGQGGRWMRAEGES